MFKASLAAVALIAGVIPVSAAAQGASCAPRDVVVARLADTFGESRQSMGLAANNALVEVFASAETGSWTITVTSASGLTCLIAAGQAFEPLVEALPAEGNDA